MVRNQLRIHPCKLLCVPPVYRMAAVKSMILWQAGLFYAICCDLVSPRSETTATSTRGGSRRWSLRTFGEHRETFGEPCLPLLFASKEPQIGNLGVLLRLALDPGFDHLKPDLANHTLQGFGTKGTEIHRHAQPLTDDAIGLVRLGTDEQEAVRPELAVDPP